MQAIDGVNLENVDLLQDKWLYLFSVRGVR